MTKQISVDGHHVVLKEAGKGPITNLASLKTLAILLEPVVFCVIRRQFSIGTHCWPYVPASAV